MTSLPAVHPRPSVMIALELFGFDEPGALDKRVLRAMENVRDLFGRALLGPPRQHRLLIAGRRVLRAAPIQPGGAVLFRELLDIAHLQSALAFDHVLLRGAITFGDAAAGADAILGPAVSAAELLCDTVADMPRVIVDPRLLREVEKSADLRAEHHTVPMELQYIRGLLHPDMDGLWFVDYLKAFESEVDTPGEYVGFLNLHASLVKRGLEACTVLNRDSRAWTWLWRYHNRVVDECFDRQRINETERAQLRVPADGPLFYVFPPSANEPE